MHIRLIEKHYSCYDGCCDEWWITLYINGEEVKDVFSSNEDAYKYVLDKYFGCKIEEDFID